VVCCAFPLVLRCLKYSVLFVISVFGLLSV